MKLDFDFLNLEKTTFCVLRFFYSFIASDGSEESIAGRVVSPCSIILHHGHRSKEARRARKQKYRLRQITSHSSLLVACQDDISRKLNQVFLLVDSFNFNFVDEECSDIYNDYHTTKTAFIIYGLHHKNFSIWEWFCNVYMQLLA